MASFDRELEKAKKLGNLPGGRSAGKIIKDKVSQVTKGLPTVTSSGSFRIPQQPTSTPQPVQSASVASPISEPNPINPSSNVLGENIRQVDPDNIVNAFSQINGERRQDVFGAFDSSGNKIQFNPNQRNQASPGVVGGSQTSDASGTGALSTTSFNNPVAQLARFREITGNNSGSSRSKVNFIPNSYARERNARLNDPTNRLLGNLESAVRRGTISPANAFKIAQGAIGDQQDAQLGRAKLFQQINSDQATQSFRERQLQSQENLAFQKLQQSGLEGSLDRQSREAIANQRASQEAARLGLDIEKLSETQRSNLARESQARDKLGQEGLLGLGKLSQTDKVEAGKLTQARQKLASTILKNISEGGDERQNIALLNEILGPEVTSKIFPDYFTTE